MPPPLDYATPRAAKTKAQGFGYSLLMVVNIVALVLTVILFFIEISGSHAAVLGVFLGPPLVGGQLVLAAVPSCAYVGVRGAEMSTEAKVKLIGIAAVTHVLGILGIVLSWVGG